MPEAHARPTDSCLVSGPQLLEAVQVWPSAEGVQPTGDPILDCLEAIRVTIALNEEVIFGLYRLQRILRDDSRVSRRALSRSSVSFITPRRSQT